jgi:NADH-quinone oxidoreductase subunit D
MSDTHVVHTSEGDQELAPRDRSSERQLLLETGAVLRMSEADAAKAIAEAAGTDEETFLLNMGPQHPSTHGVLRLMLELQGETVLRTKPIIGYLHTGMEKTGEDLNYLQGPTNTTRMDYASPFFN